MIKLNFQLAVISEVVLILLPIDEVPVHPSKFMRSPAVSSQGAMFGTISLPR